MWAVLLLLLGDATVQTQAMKASTVAEFFIEKAGVRVELTDRFSSVRSRIIGSGYFGDEKCGLITCDSTRGGHFQMYGGGHRRGVLWCDRSFGLGNPDPLSFSYRVSPEREMHRDLPEAVVKALRAFVTRF